MTTETITLVVLALIGASIGSFLNVCIYRLPRRESLVWPASHCTSCGRTLAWYENVPIVGWLALRGRCRTCGERISIVYPIVEVVTALVFVGGYLIYGWTPLLAVRLLFACAMIVLFAIDLEHQILPNVITLPGIVFGFIASVLLPPGWVASLIGIVSRRRRAVCHHGGIRAGARVRGARDGRREDARDDWRVSRLATDAADPGARLRSPDPSSAWD